MKNPFARKQEVSAAEKAKIEAARLQAVAAERVYLHRLTMYFVDVPVGKLQDLIDYGRSLPDCQGYHSNGLDSATFMYETKNPLFITTSFDSTLEHYPRGEKPMRYVMFCESVGLREQQQQQQQGYAQQQAKGAYSRPLR